MTLRPPESSGPPDRAGHPLLAGGAGHVALLLGNEAIVRGALEAGVAFACGYPGTPSSEVTDSFAAIARRQGIAFEYSVNEKVAVEMAFAASLAGARSICAMKHLGLMAAGDPISTIPYVGVVAGMVIVSAGDPGCATSPNEQDQRRLGPMLHLPTLDPSTPQEALEMTRLAFTLSERSRLPVLLRTTTRVAHTRAAVTCGEVSGPRVTGFVRDRARFVPIPPNARRMRREIPARLAIAREEMRAAGLFRRSGAGKRAVLATGAPAATCGDVLREAGLAGEVVFATVGGVHPLPEAEIVALLHDVESVLVVEELSPFLEDAVREIASRHGLQVDVLGKRTEHFPEEFEYDPPVIRRGLHEAYGLGEPIAEAPELRAVPPRPPVLCPSCPHRSSYFAARAAFGEDQLYFNDIGCYTLGYGPPLDTADALLCMGAGFTLAAGVARVTGQRTVGFLGDSTFFHSGMPALLDAIKEDVGMVAVVLDNRVTAMTGFQESPTTSVAGGGGEHPASIEDVVRALGAPHVERVRASDLPTAIAAFERARDAEGLSVVICEESCPVHLQRIGDAHERVVYEVDPDRCQRCGRDECGMRCDQGVRPGLERQMARSRVLETESLGRDDLEATAPEPVAPCALQCPLGLCIQGYAGHVAAGDHAQALELIMSRCALPDTVCRVCDRPCEPACVRRDVDGSVAVNDLKRFVMDWAAAQEPPVYRPRCDEAHGSSVAIVGAGPAGLGAAHELRLRGHAVTLYDGASAPGGLLRSGIAGFRLPPEALERDVARILGLGVSFVGETWLGRDVRLADLLERHDAVFLALGATRPLKLDLPSEAEAPPVVEALSYLGACVGGRPLDTPQRVAVVGGGNAAMDAARAALRSGARSVVAIFPEPREAMPALRDEIEAAEAEGVELRPGLRPVRFVGGKSPGLACTDEGAGADVLVAADQVIVAIGQAPDPEVLGPGDPTLERDRGGCLVVDPETCRTSHPRVHAGGDVAPGARTVTAALAQGQRAAWAIDRALRGEAVADRRAPPPRPGAWLPAGPAGPARHPVSRPTPRVRPRSLSPAQAVEGFDEVVASLTESAARVEAARCLACGQCGNCRACLDLFGCPSFHLVDGRIHIDPSSCTGCGVCATFCPNGAIRPVTEAAP